MKHEGCEHIGIFGKFSEDEISQIVKMNEDLKLHNASISAEIIDKMHSYLSDHGVTGCIVTFFIVGGGAVELSIQRLT